MNAMPQRREDRPPSRERIEQMIRDLQAELVIAKPGDVALGPEYLKAAIYSLRWVLGDPETPNAPMTGQVLDHVPDEWDIRREHRLADDVIHGREPKPDERLLGRQIVAYEHHLWWAVTGRGAPLDYDNE